jgi:hypothetical protein
MTGLRKPVRKGLLILRRQNPYYVPRKSVTRKLRALLPRSSTRVLWYPWDVETLLTSLKKRAANSYG